MAFRLSIVAGKGEGREFAFDQSVVRIGRRPTSDLVLYDTSVSRAHCEILEENGVYRLRDLGSSNGTLVNGCAAAGAQLCEGDRIQIGLVMFAFAPQRAGERLPRSSDNAVYAPDDPRAQLAIEQQPTDFLPDDVEAAAHRATGETSLRQVATLRRWYAALPRSTRRTLAASLAVIAMGAIAAMGIVAARRPPPDRSTELFALGDTDTALRFGAGDADVFTPDRASFRFEHRGGGAMLSYGVLGTSGPRELAIRVNGIDVGWAPASSGPWVRHEKLRLPRTCLRPGPNVVTFDNVLAPSQKSWSVTQVRIEAFDPPAPDPARADELFERGLAAFAAEGASPENLWRAIEYFEASAAFLERLEPPSARLAHVEAAATRAREELQHLFVSNMGRADEGMRAGDREQGVRILRELLRYFPDDRDERRDLIEARLDELLDPRYTSTPEPSGR